MNAKPRQNTRVKLVSSLGMGLLALSICGVAYAQEPGAGAGVATKPVAKGAPAKKPAVKPTTPAKPSGPGKAVKKTLTPAPNQRGAHPPGRLKTTGANPHKGLKGPHGKIRPGATLKGAAAIEEGSAQPKKGPSRKDREVAAEARVKRRIAIARYRSAKMELLKADKSLSATGESDLTEARAERKAAANELKYARKALLNSHKSGAKRYKAEHKGVWKEYSKKLRLREAALRKDRKTRADSSRGALEKRFGRKLELKTMRQELQSHAWRVARLKRLIEIAEVTERPEAKERAEKILKAEMSAHKKRLAKLSLAPLPKPKPKPVSKTAVKGAKTSPTNPHAAVVKKPAVTTKAPAPVVTPPKTVAPSSKGAVQ